MALPIASAPSILRAAQKDEYFTDKLTGSTSEVLRLFGNKIWHRYVHLIPFMSHLTYNSLTTLRDLQTLGEEYTGIVQVDDSYMKIPLKLFQVICILLGACGEKVAKNLINKLKDNVLKNKEMLPQPKNAVLNFLSVIQWSLPIIQEFHQACFFLGANYYNIPKRVTGVNYVAAVPGRRPRVGTLRPLGIPYLLRATLSAVRSPPNFEDIKFNEEKSKKSLILYAPCPGCLEDNSSPCALPCGHVLCNKCCRSVTNCVLCRAPYLNHRAVPLQNYVLRNL